MRIGVDACCWVNGRGYGRFTRELLRAMVQEGGEEEFHCIVDDEAAERFDLEGPNVRTIRAAQRASPTRAAAANGYRSPGDMLRLTRAAWELRADVFFSPTVYTYFPLPPGQRAVVTIHDTIPERFPDLTLPTARARLFWKAKLSLAILQARVIVTVSEYAARDIAQVYGVRRDRMRVLGGAPTETFRPSDPASIARTAARYGLEAGQRWFVYVGGFNPHKRVESAVRAHAVVAAESSADPPHLLLVGALEGDVFHGSLERIRAEIASCGTERLVHWTGFVPDEELRDLHSGARALVLPSEAEGFGLPAVEAAACGAPAIATTASPLPQLLGGAGIFVAPGDEPGIARAMRRLDRDDAERNALGAMARRRAAALTWARAARRALDTLREAAQ